MTESTKYIMTHDTFIKRSMSRPEVAKEFFEATLPVQILELVDLFTLTPQDTAFADNILGRGIVDILYSVQWCKQQGYISLLLEHQSTPDPLMTFRIQKYMLRLCDEHIAQHPGSKLPPIYPLLLYSGKTRYTSPLSFWELFSEPGLAKQCFTDPIHLLELRTMEDIDLQHRYHIGIVLSIMRAIAIHSNSEDILSYLRGLQPVIHKLSKEGLHAIGDVLCYVLDNVKSKEEKLVVEIFANAVSEELRGSIMSITGTIRDEARQEGIELGMQRGMQCGIQRGIEQVARNLLASNMSIDAIAKATKLSLEEVKALKETVH